MFVVSLNENRIVSLKNVCLYFVTSVAFMMLGSSPLEHYFKLFPFLPHNLRKVMAAMQKELCLLHSSLPSGILLRCYEDRMVRTYRAMCRARGD